MQSGKRNNVQESLLGRLEFEHVDPSRGTLCALFPGGFTAKHDQVILVGGCVAFLPLEVDQIVLGLGSFHQFDVQMDQVQISYRQVDETFALIGRHHLALPSRALSVSPLSMWDNGVTLCTCPL